VGEVPDAFYLGGRKSVCMSEGSQAQPARLCDEGSVKVRSCDFRRGPECLVNCITGQENLVAFTTGCMRSTQWRLGTWEPSQLLLEDRAKPRKPGSIWPVAGLCRCSLTSSQQSRKRSEQANIVPVFNSARRHEDVWVSGGIDPPFLTWTLDGGE
jgi:hypothetical protein